MKTAIDPVAAARRFRALSDETRLGILRELSSGERCVCELQASLDAAQSRLSFHLRTLKDAGLVSDRREGRWSFYSLEREALEEVSGFVASVLAEEGSAAPSARCRD